MRLRETVKFFTIAAACALAWGDHQPVHAQEPLPVVASFSILGDMTRRVGGPNVQVTTLVGPNGDPHVYQPTPTDARKISDARLLVVNGLLLEGWLERLIDATEFSGTIVTATLGIDPLRPKALMDEEDDHHDDHGHEARHDDDHDDHDHEAMHDDDHDDHDHEAMHDDDHDDHDHEAMHDDDHDDHDHDDHGHEARHDDDHDDHGHEAMHDDDHDDHGHEAMHDDDHDDHGHEEDHEVHADHDHGEFDPHAWQSLNNAKIYIRNIAEALSAADPSNAAEYETNRAAYAAEMDALDAEIHDLLAAIPEAHRTVVTSHDAFLYFGEEYGLTFVSPSGVSTDSEASAKDISRLIELIRDQEISAIFTESTSDPRLLQRIADETGASIGGILYPGGLSMPDGPAPTYLDMMRHNAETIASALGET